jgi:hypothetical protein
MPFTPNDYVLDQLITLLELWKDRSSNNNSRLTYTMKTKKFISMIRGGLSKEMLIKYWENVPVIRELIEKPNFDEVKLKTEEPEPTDEPIASTEQSPPSAEMELEPTEQLPLDSDVPATQPTAEFEPQPTGSNPKDIVATMARRRKERVMEQARRAWKTRGPL